MPLPSSSPPPRTPAARGVLLDCADSDAAHKAAYTALAQALKGAMEEGWVLYVTAQAPVWQGESPGL